MKKFILLLSMIIFSTICSISFTGLVFTKPLNASEVKSIDAYISSDEFKGRLTGTLENYEVANFIKNYFQDNNIKPFNGSYFQKFTVIYPKKVSGEPSLVVKDKNGFTVKQYKYTVDYKEDLLNFRNNSISFSNNDTIIWKDNTFQVQKGKDYFLFYNPKDDNLSFRSSFIANSPHSMYIMVKKHTSQEIKNYLDSGYEISCSIPFENKFTSAYNVIGYIQGRDPKLPPLVLSAHFDHLGQDLSGTTYDGALDNASGTSFLMELTKYINSLGKPDRNIIIAAFNAEEFGCLGSKNFVKEYKQDLKGGKVINFDMIGSNKKVPISIMAGKWDSKDSSFVKEIAQLCKTEGENFKYTFENASDHEYFRAYGIDAVTLSDADTSRIHTPLDKSAYIDTKSIKRCFAIVSKEIEQYAFEKDPYLLYSRELFSISLAGIIISCFLYSRYIKGNML